MGFAHALLTALYISGGFLLVCYLFLNPEPLAWVSAFDLPRAYPTTPEGLQDYRVEFGAALLLLLTGNILGPITARRLNRSQRQSFARRRHLEREMEERRSAERHLAQARDTLETQVRERTADLQEAKQQLEWQANFDPLTGLPNRWLVQDRLRQAISRQQRLSRDGALLFIDLDRFKQVNDSLGHSVGDLLLTEAALRLRGNLRQHDTVGRFGGDEFVVIIEDTPSPGHLEPVIHKITADMARPFHVQGSEIFLSASMGITLFPSDSDDPSILLSHTDAAMYRAKEAGGGTYRFFSPQMNLAAVERMRMDTELRRALERDEFQLHYQPLVDSHSGRIVAAEALLRWQSASLGPVSPAMFIPLAEQTGLIEPIGGWVLQQACRQALSWSVPGQPPPKVAINVSARQLQTGDFPQRLQHTLDETGLPAERLELELTESFLAQDPDFAQQQLRQIKAIGCELSIDDFGTGYSALSYLRQFPFSTLKIDRAFMPRDEQDDEQTRLVSAIIAMAQNLNLKTIAEGVETPAQWRFLRQRGCDLLQGFYMSRPVAAEAFAGLLASGFFAPPNDEIAAKIGVNG